MIRDEIVKLARDCIGTPWMHEGRTPALGLDCLGLPMCIGWELGLVDRNFDVHNYSRNPDGKTLMTLCRKHLAVEITDKNDLQPGDIVVLKYADRPQHFGIIGNYIYGGNSIIHACNRNGRVVEHRLLFGKAMQFVAGFKFNGVD